MHAVDMGHSLSAVCIAEYIHAEDSDFDESLREKSYHDLKEVGHGE